MQTNRSLAVSNSGQIGSSAESDTGTRIPAPSLDQCSTIEKGGNPSGIF